MIFNKLPIGIARLGKRMEFLEINPAFEELIGHKSEEVVGKNLYDFINEPSGTQPGHLKMGDTVVEAWTIPLRNGSGEVSSYVLVAKDVTRDKRKEMMTEGYILSLEKEIQAKKREFRERLDTTVKERTKELRDYSRYLERSNRLKETFIEVLCHDLLNPVGIARNYLELLMEEEVDPQRLDELKAVDRSLEKMVSLLEDASKYARLESVEELDLEKRDIGEIFKKVVKELKPVIEKKKIKLRFRPWRKYHSLVDESLADVFHNLLSNAIKYSPSGGRVVVDILDNGNSWKVMVKDYGEGVPDEDKQAIFERFERKSKNGVKGSGFGLALVKRAVELHRGRVWVEDNPDGGSIFYVSLPKA
jgi:signal transduction histidine kinase